MNDILIMAISTLGALIILIAAIGVLRMPDFYLRLSVTIKAATLGIGLLLLAAAIFFGDISVNTRAIAIVFFLFLTTPVAGHMISRASHFMGIKLWKGSVLDELSGKYDRTTHELRSEDEETKSESESI
jgi:multicomponent Na+:H+ antiporter subunit G